MLKRERNHESSGPLHDGARAYLALFTEASEAMCPNFGQGYRPDLFCPGIRIREAIVFSMFWQLAWGLDQCYKDEIPYWCLVWPGSRMLARQALDSN